MKIAHKSNSMHVYLVSCVINTVILRLKDKIELQKSKLRKVRVTLCNKHEKIGNFQKLLEKN